MTRVGTTNSPRAWKHVGVAVGMAILSQLLFACSTQNGLTIPSLVQTSAPASANAAASQIALAKIIGAPPKATETISGELIKAAPTKQFALTQDATVKAAHNMQGYLIAASNEDGTKLTYVWDLSDSAGKHVHRIKGEEILSTAKAKVGTDPWTMVTDQTLKLVAEKTAAKIAAWLPKPALPATGPNMMVAENTQPAPAADPIKTAATTKVAEKPKTITPPKAAAAAKSAATPTVTAKKAIPKPKPKPTLVAQKPKAATQPIKVAAKPITPRSIPAKPSEPDKIIALVPTVLGAPGDGTISLTSAIKRQLGSRGVVLASAATKSAYTVHGQVRMTPTAQSDKEEISIEWRVISPSGRKLGTVSQKNSIPKGSLDGAWGQTADAAASAAAEGIVKLLPKNNNLTSKERLRGRSFFIS